MTRDDLEHYARAQVADFQPVAVEWIGLRALRKPVWAWDQLTHAQLWAIVGACAAMRTILAESGIAVE